MHTCYKIYGYFEFQFFTYHLSPVVHSATLKKFAMANFPCESQGVLMYFVWNVYKDQLIFQHVLLLRKQLLLGITKLCIIISLGFLLTM